MLNYNEIIFNQVLSDFRRCGYTTWYISNRNSRLPEVLIQDPITKKMIGWLAVRNGELGFYAFAPEPDDLCYRYQLISGLAILQARKVKTYL